jgi:hypothetical protein
MLEGLTVEAVGKILGGLGIVVAAALLGWLILKGGKALVSLGGERERRKGAEGRERAIEKRVEALLRTLPRGSDLRRRWDRLRNERRPPAE